MVNRRCLTMTEFHIPQIDDMFWDGGEEPQPNGIVIDVQGEGADMEVTVLFHDSYHRRVYANDEIKHSYVHSRNLYHYNKEARTDGFYLTNGVDHNDPSQRGY